MNSGRGEGEAKGVGAGVEMGAAEDVKVMTDSESGEVGEAVMVGAAGKRGKRSPGGGGGVEEERADDGWIGGEEAEDVARGEAEEAAERNDGGVG